MKSLRAVRSRSPFWHQEIFGHFLPPHPGPLPKERVNVRPSRLQSSVFRLQPRQNAILPLPKGPHNAKRSSLVGKLTGGGLGKPLGRGEGDSDVHQSENTIRKGPDTYKQSRLNHAVIALLFLTAFCPAARAFNFAYDTNGVPRHWVFTNVVQSAPTNSFDYNTKSIRYYISSDGWSTTNTAAELNAIRNSFGQWQAIPGTVIKFEEAGFVAPGYRANAGDNTNVVYWAKTSTLNQDDITGAVGLTYSSFTVPGNVILQWDIVLNGWQYNWFTEFNDKNNPGFFV